MSQTLVVEVVVDVPLHRRFDYQLERSTEQVMPQPGCRVQVPFGRKQRIGLVTALKQTSEFKLKPVTQVLDEAPVLDEQLLHLCEWLSHYYCSPIGQAFATLTPKLLLAGKAPALPKPNGWRLATNQPGSPARSVQQQAILDALQAGTNSQTQLINEQQLSRAALSSLANKGVIEACHVTIPKAAATSTKTLNDEQQQAADAIGQHLEHFRCTVLDGVTGSGKTEVYLELCQRILAAGCQVLVLVPEIGLTPQTLSRFSSLPGLLLSYHSGMTDKQRLECWQAARMGLANIIIGTRSACFLPFKKLGLIVVDEEHDGAYKQQDQLRYNARDICVYRAKQQNCPIVLGSATPALETLANIDKGKYHSIKLNHRALAQSAPAVQVVAVNSPLPAHGLTPQATQKVEEHLQAGNQVLLFLNRRGYAPALMCFGCNWLARCQQCDSNLTVSDHRSQQLSCHHCGSNYRHPKACPDCSNTILAPVGVATAGIEHALQEHFPGRNLVRFDRDSITGKQALNHALEQVRSGHADILIGTQMIAKGHDFANLTLVCIIDTDQSLFSADFRAGEKLAQLLVQVGGRAGRANKAGEVIIQTSQPKHPLLQTLLSGGYRKLAQQQLKERQQCGWPPSQRMITLRAHATSEKQLQRFMEQARQLALPHAATGTIELLGPAPALLKRRAGQTRMQLALLSANNTALHAVINTWHSQLKPGAVRWSLDVDPTEF